MIWEKIKWPFTSFNDICHWQNFFIQSHQQVDDISSFRAVGTLSKLVSHTCPVQWNYYDAGLWVAVAQQVEQVDRECLRFSTNPPTQTGRWFVLSLSAALRLPHSAAALCTFTPLLRELREKASPSHPFNIHCVDAQISFISLFCNQCCHHHTLWCSPHVSQYFVVVHLQEPK